LDLDNSERELNDIHDIIQTHLEGHGPMKRDEDIQKVDHVMQKLLLTKLESLEYAKPTLAPNNVGRNVPNEMKHQNDIDQFRNPNAQPSLLD
jgi:hypothetical protein